MFVARRPVDGDWYVERALDAWGLSRAMRFAYQRKEYTEGIDEVLRYREEEGLDPGIG